MVAGELNECCAKKGFTLKLDFAAFSILVSVLCLCAVLPHLGVICAKWAVCFVCFSVQ